MRSHRADLHAAPRSELANNEQIKSHIKAGACGKPEGLRKLAPQDGWDLSPTMSRSWLSVLSAADAAAAALQDMPRMAALVRAGLNGAGKRRCMTLQACHVNLFEICRVGVAAPMLRSRHVIIPSLCPHSR